MATRPAALCALPAFLAQLAASLRSRVPLAAWRRKALLHAKWEADRHALPAPTHQMHRLRARPVQPGLAVLEAQIRPYFVLRAAIVLWETHRRLCCALPVSSVPDKVSPWRFFVRQVSFALLLA